MTSPSSDPAQTAPAELALPPQLDFAAAGSLHEALVAALGRPLSLDGSGVASVGTLAAQLLLAARRRWTADGLTLQVLASPALADGLAQLGLDPHDILGETTP